MSILYTEPELPVEPSEPDALCYCSLCMQGIYDGECYGLDIHGRPVCMDCVSDQIDSLSAEKKIEALGMMALYAHGK